jgi:cytochrome c oxidase assembly protein subunit 15
MHKNYARFAALAALLTFIVVVFGAYVRLSDAGLGCPDWPGCYGHVGVPDTPEAIAQANAAHPERPVEPAKAWKEMYHRYLASGLGGLILILALAAWGYRSSGLPVALPTLLVVLVIFQGLLGMWTVTMQVNPTIVTAHLAGGLATLMLLWWLALRTGNMFAGTVSPPFVRLRSWLWGGLILVIIQVLLGGWTSTNYAAAACIEFPTCYAGTWWPPTDFYAGFNLWQDLGTSASYEGGVLENAARVAIQLAHRIGAVVVLVYVLVLSLQVMQRASSVPQITFGVMLHLLLLAQVALGIAVVLNYRQLEVAVAHNAVAALLLMIILALIHLSRPPNAVSKARPVIS